MKRAFLPVLLTACLAAACSGHGHEATAAAASPTAEPTTAAPPVTGQVPEDFAPVSATFVSDRLGWVLGSTSCFGDDRRCALVARTTDGGRTWRAVSKPPGDGQGDLRFANARDGFLLGDGLLATHDGGRTWRTVDTLRDAIHEPWSAEAARGQLWLTGRIDHGGRGLWVGSVRSASFDFAPVTLPDGDGTDMHLSLHGPAVVVAFLDGQAPRIEVSEDGDTFVKRALPCASDGPLAMRSTREYLLVCTGDAVQGDPRGVRFPLVSITEDGGRTWKDVGTPAPVGTDYYPLATADSLFVVADRALQVSRDGGATWKAVPVGCEAECVIRAAGFESARLGFAIESAESETTMRLTRDDGRTWQKVDFRRTP